MIQAKTSITLLFLLLPTFISSVTVAQNLSIEQKITKLDKSAPHVWVINKKLAAYEHVVEVKGYHILSNVNVDYEKYNNRIRVISNDLDTTFLSMDNESLSGGLVKYNNDTAAKFSMIAAELGGSILRDYKKSYNEALIISASMDNRLRVDSMYPTTFCKNYMKELYEEGTYQSLFTSKQYCASIHKSYKSFSYGMNARTKKRLKQIVGLCAVWNSIYNSVEKLEKMGMKEARRILGYCHGGVVNFFMGQRLDFSMLDTDRMKTVATSTYYTN